MARPVTYRDTFRVPSVPEEENDIQALPFFVQPKGMVTNVPLTRLGKNASPYVLNLRIHDGKHESRPGITTVGPLPSGGTQMLVVNFVNSTNESFVFRFDLDYIYKYDSVSWNALTGAGPFTGTTVDQWTVTAWNDALIVSNGIDGMYYIDPTAGTITTIADAPAARHITTWNGRVIASFVYEDGAFHGNRIRWCAKNDYTDWDGLGSGFEDLLSAPGGAIDSQLGVFPATEEIALVVRSGSIWQAVTTGDADAPFRFGRLYAGLGARSRFSIAATPEGIIMYGLDDIYEVTLAGHKRIGTHIWHEMNGAILDPTACWGHYNPFTDRYYLAICEEDRTRLNAVWSYNRDEKAWHREEYPFDIRSIGYTRWSTSITIDQLTGTLDDLIGTIDTLGQSENGEGMYFVQADSPKYIMLQNPQVTQDVDSDGAATDSAIELWTGAINFDNPLKKTGMVAVQMEYECTTAQTIICEYSLDGGTTWSAFGSASGQSITTTTKPEVLQFVMYIEGNDPIIRLRSTTLGAVKIHGVYPMASEGSWKRF